MRLVSGFAHTRQNASGNPGNAASDMPALSQSICVVFCPGGALRIIRNRKPFPSHFDITSARWTGRPTDGWTTGAVPTRHRIPSRSERATNHTRIGEAGNQPSCAPSEGSRERAAPQCLLENNSPRPLPIGARCDRDHDHSPRRIHATYTSYSRKVRASSSRDGRARSSLARAAGWWWRELVCALRLHWGRVWFGAVGCSNVHHPALAVVSSREHLRTERDNRGRSSSLPSSRGRSPPRSP